MRNENNIRGNEDEARFVKMRVIGNFEVYSGDFKAAPEDFSDITFPKPAYVSDISQDVHISAFDPTYGGWIEIENTLTKTIYGGSDVSVEGTDLGEGWGPDGRPLDMTNPALESLSSMKLKNYLYTGLFGGKTNNDTLLNITGENVNNFGSYDYCVSKFLLCHELEPIGGGYPVHVVARPPSVWALSCPDGEDIDEQSCVSYGFKQDGNPIIPFDYASGEEILCQYKSTFIGVNETLYNEITNDIGGALQSLPTSAITSGSKTWNYIIADLEDVNTLGRSRTGAGGGAGGGGGDCECPTLTTGDCPQVHVANCGSVGALWV